ncbi:hypothetical protein [Moraxella canis]|uniref:Uncharacterized protein n=1 Tax=Moraxella canis TaxID=90239 RepID=A0A1S9ZMY5_9GAMM|nr:hypothetical protein [Moraxella canis]OOR84915.1 hypothetical protein B0180_02070 [Moraxella canis]
MTTETVQDKPKTELQQLKDQADDLGLTYPAKVTAKALKQMIANELLKDTDQDISEEIQAVEDENLKLVHVVVTSMNSQKANIGFETFQVGNSVIGTIKRVVPLGKPWLVENIILKAIKDKQFQQFIERDDPNNRHNKLVESRLVPAFAVQELPLPTEEEIAELAKRQETREVID